MRSGTSFLRAARRGPGAEPGTTTRCSSASVRTRNAIVALLAIAVFGVPAACTAGDDAEPTTARSTGPSTSNTESSTGTHPESNPVEVSAEWAVEAELWSSALLELTDGDEDSSREPFWDPDVAWDIRSMIGCSAVLQGQNAFTLATALHPPGAFNELPDGPVFVSTDGLVTMTFLDWEPTGMSHVDAAEPAHLVNILDPIGAQGALRQITAMSIEDRRDRMFGADLDRAESIARHWLEGWTTGGADRVRTIYTPDAVVRDSIATVSATGLDEIVALAGDTSWPRGDLVLLGPSTPAVYPLITEQGELRGVALVVRVGPCPGELAVVLELHDGAVVSDTRYRTIADARRCLPAGDLPDGWWTGRALDSDPDRPVPEEDLATPTGSMPIGSDMLIFCNSTPNLESFVAWGIERFESAGLEPPPVSELVFTGRSECCDDVQGTSTLGGSGYEVLLCLDEYTACEDDRCEIYRFRARRALLHEFAHVWLAANLDDADRAHFTDHVGLDAWRDPNSAWSEQAVEHAAETITWGLLDEPFAPIFIGRPSTFELTRDFRLLTGVGPLQPSAMRVN